MKYEIEFTKKAIRALIKLPKTIRNSIIKKITILATDPYGENNNIKKLQGIESSYRLRVGDYRIIYRIFNKKLVIENINIGHRQGVYK